jgi:hypothetical protein
MANQIMNENRSCFLCVCVCVCVCVGVGVCCNSLWELPMQQRYIRLLVQREREKRGNIKLVRARCVFMQLALWYTHTHTHTKIHVRWNYVTDKEGTIVTFTQ